MTERELLQAAGVALYGHVGWAPRLGEDLGVNERTVLRWSAGTKPVPAGAWRDVARLLIHHSARVQHLAAHAYVAAGASLSE